MGVYFWRGRTLSHAGRNITILVDGRTVGFSSALPFLLACSSRPAPVPPSTWPRRLPLILFLSPSAIRAGGFGFFDYVNTNLYACAFIVIPRFLPIPCRARSAGVSVARRHYSYLSLLCSIVFYTLYLATFVHFRTFLAGERASMSWATTLVGMNVGTLLPHGENCLW